MKKFNIKKLTSAVAFTSLICNIVNAQTQIQDLNMGLYQLQFPSASGGSNRIQSYGGTSLGTWSFKSRFDNIILDAGENSSNLRQILFQTGGIERARFTTGGYLGLGTSNPTAKLHAIIDGNGVNFDRYAGMPVLYLRKANGLETSPTVVNANENVGAIGGSAYDGALFRTVANINFTTDNTTGLGDMPGRITFHTTLDGTINQYERMRITNNGNVGIGITNPTIKLSVGSATSGESIGFEPYTFFNTAYSSGYTSISYCVKSKLGTAGYEKSTSITAPSSIIEAGKDIVFATKASDANAIGTNWNLSANTKMIITNNGNVLIGSSNIALPIGYKLYVETGILTEKVKVALTSTSDWSDYVFAPEYSLPSLNDVKTFISKNKHLQGIPSAQQLVDDKGYDLSKMDAKLLGKIEELTLYLIQLADENKDLKSRINLLEINK